MNKQIPKIGVLAMQGAFVEHASVLHKINVETVEVRLPKDLDGVDGLIIPGGESTTIGRLMQEWDLIEAIKSKAKQGMGIWGTCAGAILLAEHVPNLKTPTLQLMDITIERNAFGRQIESFSADLNFAVIGPAPFTAVFIRAPKVTKVGPKTQVLISLDDGTIVAARQGNLLATSFHPELTVDARFHYYFLELLEK